MLNKELLNPDEINLVVSKHLLKKYPQKDFSFSKIQETTTFAIKLTNNLPELALTKNSVENLVINALAFPEKPYKEPAGQKDIADTEQTVFVSGEKTVLRSANKVVSVFRVLFEKKIPRATS